MTDHYGRNPERTASVEPWACTEPACACHRPPPMHTRESLGCRRRSVRTFVLTYWRWMLAVSVLLAVLIALAVAAGCSSTGASLSTGFGWFDWLTPDDKAAPDSGSYWPFYFAGFLTLLAGAFQFISSGNLRGIIAGGIIALVPVVVGAFLNVLLIPVSICVGLVGVVWLAVVVGRKLGWIDAKVAVQSAAPALAKLTNGSSLAPADKSLVAEVQAKLDWIGKRGFKRKEAAKPIVEVPTT